MKDLNKEREQIEARNNIYNAALKGNLETRFNGLAKFSLAELQQALFELNKKIKKSRLEATLSHTRDNVKKLHSLLRVKKLIQQEILNT